MKKAFETFVLLVGLSVGISSLQGCGFSSITDSGGRPNPGPGNGENTGSTSRNGSSTSELPPPPGKIVEAEFKMLDGKSFSLSDSEGKVILINLWATWCGPCRKEMPALVKMQEKYRDKGFEIIGLDTDPETPEQIKSFAEKMNLNYRLGWADRSMVEEFFTLGQMNGIPQSFLINREGKLAGIFQGGSERVIESMRENVERVVME